MNYQRQLADPKWQMRRLEIFKRDNCTCQICGDTNTELHIHHKRYTGKAWQAPDEDLQTLCAYCHRYVEAIKDLTNTDGLIVLGGRRMIKYLDDVVCICYLIKHTKSGKHDFTFIEFTDDLDIGRFFFLHPKNIMSLNNLANDYLKTEDNG